MRIVGTSKPIHDAVEKVTGRLQYCGDMKLRNMLYAAVLFSTIPHGMVRKIDVSEAMRLDGVVDILHCFNTTAKKFNRYRSQAIQEMAEHECVFNQHVRFIGDRVAAVVAVSEEIARAAVRLIRVEYEEFPYAVVPKEALEGKIDNVLETGPIVAEVDIEIGKAEKREDTIKVHTETKLARITHGAMETHCAVADYNKYTGELTVWSPNQATHGIRTVLGDLFEISYSKLRSIKTTMGGSFGGKQEWMLEPVVAAAAIKTGRPVKLVYNRKETIVATISRSPMDAKIDTEFTRDGKLLSLRIDNTIDAGAYMGNSKDYLGALGAKFYRTYCYPHSHYTGRSVITNSPVSGAFRGWTAPEICTMVEQNFNQAAKRLHMDPLELRLKNVAREGDIDPKLNEPYGPVRTKECIELGRKEFGWEQKKIEVKAFNRKNVRFKRGIAIACGGHVNGYYPRLADFAGAELRLAEDGSAFANLSIHDHGCGSVTAVKMILAETLQLDMERIKLKEADTDVTPLDLGCYSSRTIYVLGRAAQLCAERLIAIAVKNIAEINHISEQDVQFENGAFLAKVGSEIEKYSYSRVAKESMKLLKREVLAVEQFPSRSNPGVTGTHFAEVEVDTYTGLVKILEYLAVHDIGRAINRAICIGQIQGAVLMGSGAALIEEVITASSGRAIDSFKNYHLINAFDAPETKVILVEDGSPDGPFGAKSIGEVCHVPVAAAIMGAVNNALDSDFGEIPINTDSIVKLMADRNRAGNGEA